MTKRSNETMRAVTDAFEAAADPEAAAPMKAYMRDQFEFLGISSTARVALSRAAVAGLARPAQPDLIAVARSCWKKPAREYQYFALWYLRRHVKALDVELLSTAEHMIVTKSWWDTVDELAQNIVGAVVREDPAGLARMDAWAAAPNFWLNRTAILFQTRYKADTDVGRLFGYCEQHAADQEFFIRKAIGWALREHSKTDAAAVRQFVRAHDAELSGLSKREALKWLERKAARAAI